MRNDSPSGGVAAARALLDRALLELRRIEDPALAVRDAKGALGDAMVELYHAEDERGSWDAFRARVESAARSVREVLQVLQETVSDDLSAHRCLETCAEALGRILSATLPPLEAPLPLPRTAAVPVATHGEPALISFTRPAVHPEVPFSSQEPAPPAAEPLPLEGWPTDLDTLIALAEASIDIDPSEGDEDEPDDSGPEPARPSQPRPAAPAPAEDPREVLFGTAIPEADLLLARAEQLLVDLASMGRMRYPQDELPWLHGEETERRLLCRIDALVACGVDVLPHLVAVLADRPLPDPELGWALVMWLGCLDGADSLDEIARLLATLPLDDPEVAGATADALMLAPHPGIGGLVRPWLASTRGELRRAAAHVLGHRRELGLDEIRLACRDPDDDVALQGARALELYEGAVPDEELARLVRHRRPMVARAGMFAALAHRRELGVRRAIDLCATEPPETSDAAMIIAVGASRDEAERTLLDAARAKDDPFVLRALGWHGSVAALELLIEKLSSEQDGVALAAAAALERITQALLLPEGPLPEHAPGDLPFRRAWAPPIWMPEPCVDPKRWNEWWTKHRGEARRGTRYRHGHAWSLRDDLHVLEDPASTLADRRWAWLELCARSGASFPIDPHRFLAHQRGLLERWRAHVSRSLGAVPDGSWPVRYTG